MKLTDQQEQIVRSTADVLKVKAFAGCGKTSTLLATAKGNPQLKILYLAYNKSIQMEAKDKFPRNTSVRTVSSIAYGDVGKNYADKMVSTVRNYDVIKALELTHITGENEQVKSIYAMRIIEGINRFISSDDDEITQDHIKFLNTPSEKNFSDYEAVKVARKVWSIMCDKENKRIGMTHDGYLKLYRQAGGGFDGYDLIMLDEAQDSSPVTIAMFEEARCRKIMVGDPHQAIYQFRGAVDAMDILKSDEDHILSKSFRFGDRVSMLANCILNVKKEDDLLVGLGQGGSSEPIDPSEKRAFIARSNATVFSQAHAALKARKSIHLIGGPAGYRLDMVKDAHYLKMREKHNIKNAFIKAFSDFSSFEDYSSNSLDPETQMLCRVINDMKNQNVPLIVDAIYKSQTQRSDDAMLILTTAHKAKGLEFDNVILDDYFYVSRFKTQTDKEGKKLPDIEVTAPVDEINLAYVSVTRAKKKIECKPLEAALSKHKYMVHAKMLGQVAAEKLQEIVASEEKVIAKTDYDIDITLGSSIFEDSTPRLNLNKTIPEFDRKETVTAARKRMRRL